MSIDTVSAKPLTPTRLRAVAEWFREFALLGPLEQRLWQLWLAAHYEALADELDGQPDNLVR